MKTLNNFINEVLGKSFDYDKVSGVQCVDLIKRYLKECFNLNVPLGFGNAVDYYVNFSKKKLLTDNFKRIENTPDFIPEAGDIVVWNEKRGKGAGHVAIATGKGDLYTFYSYDLNWNNRKKVQEVRHDYKNVYGVLRYNKKEENKVSGKVGIKVLFTGAKTINNSLVEYNRNQFWILNKEFDEKKSIIYGTVCFEQENSIGLAFHYESNNSIKEFQMNVRKSDIVKE